MSLKRYYKYTKSRLENSYVSITISSMKNALKEFLMIKKKKRMKEFLHCQYVGKTLKNRTKKTYTVYVLQMVYIFE